MKTCVRLPGEARPVPGHFAEVPITSKETGERFCIVESTLAAGGGLTSRRHLHRTYVESWFIVGGTLEFCSGDERLLAPAGSFVLAPPSSHHTFGNGDAGETQIVGFYAPGGMDRFIAELGRIRSLDDPGFGVTGALFNKYATEPAEDYTPPGPPVRLLLPGEGEHFAIGGAAITI